MLSKQAYTNEMISTNTCQVLLLCEMSIHKTIGRGLNTICRNYSDVRKTCAVERFE